MFYLVLSLDYVFVRLDDLTVYITGGHLHLSMRICIPLAWLELQRRERVREGERKRREGGGREVEKERREDRREVEKENERGGRQR